MGFVSLGRYGRLQRVQNRCCSLLVCFLFQIVVSWSLSTVFVRLSFSHNCLCHCVLVLVCNYPATHPQVLTPDGFSEDFFNHLKVRYNMKKGFPKYSTSSRNNMYCSLGAYQPPAPPIWEIARYPGHRPIASISCGSISVRTNRHFEKKSKKKLMTSHQKKFFFCFSLFLVLATLLSRFENFTPIWSFWISVYVPRNNSEWWQARKESCIPGCANKWSVRTTC